MNFFQHEVLPGFPHFPHEAQIFVQHWSPPPPLGIPASEDNIKCSSIRFLWRPETWAAFGLFFRKLLFSIFQSLHAVWFYEKTLPTVLKDKANLYLHLTAARNLVIFTPLFSTRKVSSRKIKFENLTQNLTKMDAQSQLWAQMLCHKHHLFNVKIETSWES